MTAHKDDMADIASQSGNHGQHNRMTKLQKGAMSADPLAPVIIPARYAKGKMIIQCPSDGSGMKTRAARLAAAVPGYYSNRSKGYVVSPSASRRVQEAYASGKDAGLSHVKGALGWTIDA